MGEAAGVLRRSSFEHIIGDSVSATTPEISTAPARSGRTPEQRTGQSLQEADGSIDRGQGDGHRDHRHGDLPAPSSAACNGDLPCSMCRWMFSTTTMASSTTVPIASTMASSVSRLIE